MRCTLALTTAGPWLWKLLGGESGSRREPEHNLAATASIQRKGVRSNQVRFDFNLKGTPDLDQVPKSVIHVESGNLTRRGDVLKLAFRS